MLRWSEAHLLLASLCTDDRGRVEESSKKASSVVVSKKKDPGVPWKHDN